MWQDFFLCLKNIPLWILDTYPGYTPLFSFSICLLMGIWVVSTSWILWIMLLWTWVCKYLSEALLSFLWDIYSEKGLLDHSSFFFFFFEEHPYCFPKQLYHFTFPVRVHKGSNFSTSSPTFSFCYFTIFYSDHDMIPHCDFHLPFPNY